MPSKRLYIHTIGCQMNVYDSEHMAMHLASLGYTPALSAEDADLIIVNTCSVRDKAEQKAFSIIGRLEEPTGRLIPEMGDGRVVQPDGRDWQRAGSAKPVRACDQGALRQSDGNERDPGAVPGDLRSR